jgi:hypothetical protein
MGTQSTAKTIFLLTSMVGWLILGAALIYLFPMIFDRLIHSDRTALWLKTLSQGGYSPVLALEISGIILAIEIAANWIWYRKFEGKV